MKLKKNNTSKTPKMAAWNSYENRFREKKKLSAQQQATHQLGRRIHEGEHKCNDKNKGSF